MRGDGRAVVLLPVHVAAHRIRATVLALLALVLAAAAGAWLVAGTLSRPARATIGEPPRELGASAVTIPSSAGAVRGWLARGAPGGGAVLLLHGVRGDRREMAGRAGFLHAAGYTVLLVDLPAHGESAGDRITFGARESAGTRAALAFLRDSVTGERVGALGVSLGGASLLLGDGGPAANCADAVVLEMVYPSIEEAVADRLRIRLGALGPPLAPILTAQLAPRLGVGPEELRPIARVGALRVPLLLVAGAEDPRTTLAESRRLFDAAPAPKELWVVPRAAHQDLLAFAPDEYERRVLAFFQRHLRGAGQRDPAAELRR